MTENAVTQETSRSQKSEITVKVTFPISRHGPFVDEVGPVATVGQVLAAAMSHFQVHDDSQFRYVLAHDGKEEPDSVTIGSIVGEQRAVNFTLIKKISQGQ